jgi:hypothetical protein
MKALLVRENLFIVVDGTKIDPNATNLTLQTALKNKGAQAQCELILNIGDQQVQLH